MTIDSAPITAAVTSVTQQGIDFLPLGIAIVGLPAAIGIGIAFGSRIVGIIKSAFGSG